MSTRYQIARDCTFSVLSANLLSVTSRAGSFELPLEHWQLLAEFTDVREAELVYREAASEISYAEFCELLEFWTQRRVLLHSDRPPVTEECISSFLRQDIFGNDTLVEQVGERLRAGDLVVVPNALDPAFAESVWHALDTYFSWMPYAMPSKTPGFHFSHHNIDETAAPDAYNRCKAMFSSDATKNFIEHLSGRPCGGPVSMTASWYQPGDYSLPHTDAFLDRQVSFVWHLAKDWDDTWAGQFAWREGTNVFPRFNSLTIFNVSPSSLHFVAMVARKALGKRFGVNGWWRSPQPTLDPPTPSEPAHVVPGHGARLRCIGGPEGVIAVS